MQCNRYVYGSRAYCGVVYCVLQYWRCNINTVVQFTHTPQHYVVLVEILLYNARDRCLALGARIVCELDRGVTRSRERNGMLSPTRPEHTYYALAACVGGALSRIVERRCGLDLDVAGLKPYRTSWY